MKHFVIIAFATMLGGILIPQNTAAQCCGAGNPISSAGSETSVKKGNLQISLDYRHSESNRYFEDTHEYDIDFPGKIKTSGYNYLALGASYGITSRLTAQIIAGYYIDKFEKYDSDMFPNVSASGIGDLSISANYAVYRNLRKGITVNPYVFIKFPIGKFDCESDGVKLPISMQPSSGSYKYAAGISASCSPIKKLHVFTNDFWEYAMRIKSHNFDYQYGSLLYVSAGVQYGIMKHFSAGLLSAYEHKARAKSDGKPLYGSVFSQIKLSPMLTACIAKTIQINLTAELPIWRKCEGIQMVNTWGLELKTTYNLKL